MEMDERYPLALPRGTVLGGQYLIDRVLGQGGFGITYRATDHKTGNYVAVKEYFPDAMATRTQTTVVPFAGERMESFSYGKTCFLQEAETLAKFIGNENIVRIHTYFEENGTAYFIMDYVEGISFDEYIKNKGGKISYGEAETILLPVIDALAAVHSKGIVHRDVTPDNIYITNDGKVKLLDFGAARYSLGDKSRSLDVVLKHGFAPKEQYTRRGKQGAFTDVYTVGATFYFAITGKRPPDSIDRLEEDELIPPSSRGAVLPREKEEAILMAMNVQPQDRFQTMVAFRCALMQADAEPMPGVQPIPNAQPIPSVQPMPGVQQVSNVPPMPGIQPVSGVQPVPNVPPMPDMPQTSNSQPKLVRVEYTPQAQSGAMGEPSGMNRAEYRQGTVGTSQSVVPPTASLETLIKRGQIAIEDQEWEKADGFFENALNIDAENAEAYLGKLMVKKRVGTLEALLLTYMVGTGNLIRSEEKQCEKPENIEAVIRDAVEKYEIPGVLEESKIRDEFDFGMRYRSELSYRQTVKKMTEDALEGDKQFCRVRTLAPKELSDRIEDAVDDLKEQLAKEVQLAQESDQKEIDRLAESYRKHLEKTEQKLAQMHEVQAKKREELYQSRVAFMQRAVTHGDYITAQKNLKALNGYKDSEELAEQCGNKIRELREKPADAGDTGIGKTQAGAMAEASATTAYSAERTAAKKVDKKEAGREDENEVGEKTGKGSVSAPADAPGKKGKLFLSLGLAGIGIVAAVGIVLLFNGNNGTSVNDAVNFNNVYQEEGLMAFDEGNIAYVEESWNVIQYLGQDGSKERPVEGGMVNYSSINLKDDKIYYKISGDDSFHVTDRETGKTKTLFSENNIEDSEADHYETLYVTDQYYYLAGWNRENWNSLFVRIDKEDESNIQKLSYPDVNGYTFVGDELYYADASGDIRVIRDFGTSGEVIDEKLVDSDVIGNCKRLLSDGSYLYGMCYHREMNGIRVFQYRLSDGVLVQMADLTEEDGWQSVVVQSANVCNQNLYFVSRQGDKEGVVKLHFDAEAKNASVTVVLEEAKDKIYGIYINPDGDFDSNASRQVYLLHDNSESGESVVQYETIDGKIWK